MKLLDRERKKKKEVKKEEEKIGAVECEDKMKEELSGLVVKHTSVVFIMCADCPFHASKPLWVHFHLHVFESEGEIIWQSCQYSVEFLSKIWLILGDLTDGSAYIILAWFWR